MKCRASVAALVAAGIAACEAAAPPPASVVHDLIFDGDLTGLPQLMILGPGGPTPLLLSFVMASEPAPSPDGDRIAYTVLTLADGNREIWVMKRDGSDGTQLTFDSEIDDHPSWSPDGTRIAFRSYRTQLDGDIWVMDADGSDPVNLTPDPVPALYDAGHPAWSPDGTRIAFASNEGGTHDIWVMNADGSGRTQLTNSIDFDVEPAWSPDGSTIVFRRSYFDTPTSDLGLVPAAGGAAQIFSRAGHERMPVFAPAGDRIVFVAHPMLLSRPDLFDMALDGTDVRSLVSDQVPGGSRNPAFLRRP